MHVANGANRGLQMLFLLAVLYASAVSQTRDAVKPSGPPIDLATLTGPISLTAGNPVARQVRTSRRPALNQWAVTSGELPAGLEITPAGVLQGVPTKPGKYTFTLTARDDIGTATFPPTVINVTESIAITWKQAPRVDGDDSVVGSLEITNYLSKAADLTLIVVAVNEINKAFALGYQHYTIQPNSRTRVIPFGASLPFGGYVVHADAIAEVPEPKLIYRSRLQTETRLVLAQR